MKDPQFTGDWFETLLKGIKSSVSRSFEKRASPRVGVTMAVDMCHLQGGQPKRIGMARLRSVSRTGVGFTFTRRILPEGEFCITFPRIGEGPLMIGYQCVYCRKISDRIFSIGARLLWLGTPPDSESQRLNFPQELADEAKRIRQEMLR